jgi:hypothetical protein
MAVPTPPQPLLVDARRIGATLVEHETPAGVLLGASAWLVTARRP